MAKYERLSPLDRTFLDLEYPETHMHVAGVTIFDAIPLRTPDGGIDIEKIRKFVASRLHLMPRYRQRIARIPLRGSSGVGGRRSTSTWNITFGTLRCRGPAATSSSSD